MVKVKVNVNIMVMVNVNVMVRVTVRVMVMLIGGELMDRINVNGIEYVKAKGVKRELVITDKTAELPFEIDRSYFIRTVTYHMIGKVKQITGSFLVLENASWIADSGRFSNAIKEGELDEVEPVGMAFLNTHSIVDAFPWIHPLPEKQK